MAFDVKLLCMLLTTVAGQSNSELHVSDSAQEVA